MKMKNEHKQNIVWQQIRQKQYVVHTHKKRDSDMKNQEVKDEQ